MTMIARFKCVHHPEDSEKERQKRIHDAIFLHLSRILIITLLATLGFLLSFHLESIHQSIDRITIGQERLAITAARIDEAVQNIDRRISRIENQPH